MFTTKHKNETLIGSRCLSASHHPFSHDHLYVCKYQTEIYIIFIISSMEALIAGENITSMSTQSEDRAIHAVYFDKFLYSQ